MFGPKLCARIIEGAKGVCLWVERAEIGSFMPITPPARIGEVRLIRYATMFRSDDVINFVRKEGNACQKPAILTSVTRPFDDDPAQYRRNIAVIHPLL